MKNIKLIDLTLENFKGIKEFRLVANGEDVEVFGDNGTGKTSLFDAFTYVLFDKDSQNKKDFQIKTVDDQGKEIHGLDHSVSTTFEVDGNFIEFKKVFKEKWSKKRGSAKAIFSGHTTDYFVNGVPVKKKEFETSVNELINEDVFKLLTSPTYFNEQLHWQKRRELLLSIAGDITTEEVVKENPELAPLLDKLNNRSVDDHKKVVAAKRAEINKELERLPVRIDEVNKSIEDLPEGKKEVLENDILNKRQEIEEKEGEIRAILNGTEVSNKKAEMQELSVRFSEEKQSYQQKEFSEVNRLQKELQSVRNDYQNVRMQENDVNYKIKSLVDQHERLGFERDKLLKEWKKTNEETFDSHSSTCPTCKQDLPEDQIQKAMDHFNLNKSEKLQVINGKGKEIKSKRDEIEKTISDEKEQLSLICEVKANKEAEIKELEGQIEACSTTPFEQTEMYQEFIATKQTIESEIMKLKDQTEEAASEKRKEVASLKEELSSLQAELAKFDSVGKAKERIAELEYQEEMLAEQFEEVEQDLYLIEEFIRSKVELLEEKINSKFKYARFQLFQEQINGGLQEVCETLFQGVPYSKGLNNAAKINVGLDIIETLSEYYQVSAPIFIDNAEAVTELLPIQNQVISLVVSAGDKTLRVES